MRAFLLSLVEVLEIVLVTIGAVVIIRTFLVQPFLVSGGSMEHTFENGDYLLVDQLTYRVRQPERGEVVVFRSPNDAKTYFIKRLIGLPGDRVMVSNGSVRISNREHPDGFILDESYLGGGITTSGEVDVRVGPNEFFVMGDNRAFSYDSRSWGPLSRDKIVGVARLRLWPLTEVHAFSAPTYEIAPQS